MTAREDLARAWSEGDPEAFAEAFERAKLELAQESGSAPRPAAFTVNFKAPPAAGPVTRTRTRRWVSR